MKGVGCQLIQCSKEPENDLELVEISIVTARDESFRPLKTLPAGITR